MKCSWYALAATLLAFPLSASARDVVLPAGTLLKCTLNEPNFSSATAAIGDPVLCHLHGQTEFGQQAFPRGTYLVGHLEDAKEPGHFVGKGYLKLQFDRIGLPSGDLPLESKIIATNGYKVDKEGRIDGKGHAVRDVVEWMFPPLWPWKVIMLPARGPRPKLKGESQITLRLMDDVEIAAVAETYGPGWHFFGRPQNESFHDLQGNDARSADTGPQLAVRQIAGSQAKLAADPAPGTAGQASYAMYVSRPPASAANDAVDVPGMPIFVLNTGTVLAVSGYGYQENRISYTLAAGGTGVISADEVDWPATTRLNAQRGVRVTLHFGHVNPATPGL